jgi:hypothetical protein
LLESFNNIFNPLFRRVGCFCLSLERQRDKNSDRADMGKTQRSEGWQGASVGAVSAKMFLVFVLARKRRLDLVTVRAVAERRPPERSAVDERCADYRMSFDLYGERENVVVFRGDRR